jgi:hypothetical protein
MASGSPGALVALAFAGGHDTGQVDAHGDGPGHRAVLAMLGGRVADVHERPGPGNRGQDQDGRGIEDLRGAAAAIGHWGTSFQGGSGMGG